jgi:hypothetical protein
VHKGALALTAEENPKKISGPQVDITQFSDLGLGVEGMSLPA